jgi:large subunit ribosomal protein L23
MKNPRDIILEPVVSEKSYDLVSQNNTYSFIVDPRSNKTEIKQAIESIFEVRVVGVSTMNRQGKRKRTGATIGRRKATKRALVTLQDGDSIEFFEV